MAVRAVRAVKPYPIKQEWSGVKRLRVGNLRWDLLRQKRPRRHARAYKWRTSLSPFLANERDAIQGIKGSLPERLFYQALITWGFIPNEDFTFQASFEGGRAELGGLVADFIFPTPKLIVQVQSTWHILSLATIRRDEEQRLMLENMGWTVLEIWEETTKNPAQLENWIKTHLILQWGTSSLGFVSGGSTYTWQDQVLEDLLIRIEMLADDILNKVQNGD